MSSTLDQLPDLSSEIAISEEKIKSYRRDGHVCVRKICSQKELDAFFTPIAETLETYRKERRKLEDRDTYHKAFLQVGNLWTRNEAVKKFVLARRFGKIAADLMGVDGVRLYHDQALFKEPHGGPTPWHQDQFYWPIEGNNTITMWMPFTEATVEKGAMTFASGFQNDGPMTQLAIGDESARFFSKKLRDEDLTLKTYELNPGDATWHGGWTPHKAPGNSTDEMRPVMTIIFVDADARVSEPMNDKQPMDMKAFFPGLKPGDVISSHLNPCVYHKDSTKIDKRS